MSEHENERWGRFTEWTARIVFGLDTDHSPFHDARDGEIPVEVKACVRRTARGRRGKFFIRKANHEKLREAGGYYVFVVYDPEATTDGPILDMEMKPAAWLDSLDGYRWTGNGSRRGEVVKRPPWTAVFDGDDLASDSEDCSGVETDA